MHPAIAELPARLFYSGRLRSGVTAQERPRVAGFDWPDAEAPVALLSPVGAAEERDGPSLLNRGEARAAADVVAAIRHAGTAASDIGVISPYAAQVRLLAY